MTHIAQSASTTSSGSERACFVPLHRPWPMPFATRRHQVPRMPHSHILCPTDRGLVFVSCPGSLRGRVQRAGPCHARRRNRSVPRCLSPPSSRIGIRMGIGQDRRRGRIMLVPESGGSGLDQLVAHGIEGKLDARAQVQLPHRRGPVALDGLDAHLPALGDGALLFPSATSWITSRSRELRVCDATDLPPLRKVSSRVSATWGEK